MYAPFSPPPRRSGQLLAGHGRGELPLWAVLVVAAGVLAMGLRGSRAPSVEASGDSAAWNDIVAAAESDSQDRAAMQNPWGRGPDGSTKLANLVSINDAGLSSSEADRAELLARATGEGAEVFPWAPLEPSYEVDSPDSGSGDPIVDLDRRGTSSRAPGDDWNGVREEGDFQGGVREGLWTAWRSDGTLRSRGYYAEGLRHGRWESFSQEGTLLGEVDYVSGSRHGDWRAYADDGQVLEEGQYEENAASGLWVKYYSGGSIKERGHFVNGLREGRWEFYDDVGIPTLQTGEYRAGIKVQ